MGSFFWVFRGSNPVLRVLLRAESPEPSSRPVYELGRRGGEECVGDSSSFVDKPRGEFHFPCYLQAETGPEVQDKKEQSYALQNQSQAALRKVLKMLVIIIMKVKVKSLSRVRLFATPWTVA